VSDEILVEYKRVLGRLGVRRPRIGTIVNLLREEAELCPAAALPNISPDPGDDPFCACAETGLAAFIVTLNPKDFPQSLPISSRDQTRRKHSNNRPPKATTYFTVESTIESWKQKNQESRRRERSESVVVRHAQRVFSNHFRIRLIDSGWFPENAPSPVGYNPTISP